MIKFYHVLKKSAIIKRALICYNERMYKWNICARVKALKDVPGEEVTGFCALVLFFPGVVLVLDFC